MVERGGEENGTPRPSPQAPLPKGDGGVNGLAFGWAPLSAGCGVLVDPGGRVCLDVVWPLARRNGWAEFGRRTPGGSNRTVR